MAELAQAANVPAWFEVRTRHKIALHLLPFLFLLYIVNFVDRTNLGFAVIGMERDLGFSDRVFGFGAGIFSSATWRCRFRAPCWSSAGARGARFQDA